MKCLSRRKLLNRLAGAVFAPGLAPFVMPGLAKPAALSHGESAEFDLALLDDWLTPDSLFYLRHHFRVPSLLVRSWRLKITGAVEAPLDVDYDAFLAYPRRTLPAVLECAENQVGGGLVSQAEWEGVALSSLLAAARPLPQARSVRLRGADQDANGKAYSQTIPLSKATSKDTILAYRMNGERLPKEHGFPVRAIVPGWYGMDSVKWLRHIEVGAEDVETAAGVYVRQTSDPTGKGVRSERLSAIRVKAVFSRPRDGAILFGRRMIVRGAAWAGENTIERVEISTDGGKNWNYAELSEGGRPYCWTFWNYLWRIPHPGEFQLVVRALDSRGHTQPPGRSSDRRDAYENNSYQKVLCTVVS